MTEGEANRIRAHIEMLLRTRWHASEDVLSEELVSFCEAELPHIKADDVLDVFDDMIDQLDTVGLS